MHSQAGALVARRTTMAGQHPLRSFGLFRGPLPYGDAAAGWRRVDRRAVRERAAQPARAGERM